MILLFVWWSINKPASLQAPLYNATRQAPTKLDHRGSNRRYLLNMHHLIMDRGCNMQIVSTYACRPLLSLALHINRRLVVNHDPAWVRSDWHITRVAWQLCAFAAAQRDAHDTSVGSLRWYGQSPAWNSSRGSIGRVVGRSCMVLQFQTAWILLGYHDWQLKPILNFDL